MSVSLTQFRNRVASHVSGCPFFKIDEAVRESAIEFCEDTHILKKAFQVSDETAVAADSVFDYTFDFFFSADDQLGVMAIDLTDYYTGYDPINVNWFLMDGASYGLYNVQRPTNYHAITDFDTGGQAYKLFYFNSATQLIIYPFDVGEVHDMFIQINVKPERDATTLDDELYRDWHRAIEYLAISHLQEIPGQKWSDENLSLRNYKKYSAEMGMAKIRLTDGFMHGESMISGSYF